MLQGLSKQPTLNRTPKANNQTTFNLQHSTFNLGLLATLGRRPRQRRTRTTKQPWPIGHAIAESGTKSIAFNQTTFNFQPNNLQPSTLLTLVIQDRLQQHCRTHRKRIGYIVGQSRHSIKHRSPFSILFYPIHHDA